MDLGSLGKALVPPLADVRLELIQLRFPAHAGQQLISAGGPGVLLHGPAVQAGGPADRGLRLPGLEPLADLGVAFPGAHGQPPFPAAHVQGLVRHGRRGLRPLRPRRIRSARRVRIAGPVCGGLLLQAAAVPGHRFLGVLCQVVPQVPAVGYLDRARRAVAGSLGVGAGAVPADDLRAGMGLQPSGQRARLAIRQQVDHVPGLRIGHHRAVHVPLAQREVIHPGDLRRGACRRIGQRHHQPQHGGGVHGDPEGPGQPGGGAPGQLQAEPGQHAQQRDAAPPVPLAQPCGLLGEGDRRAGRVPAAEPADLQDDQHRPATRRAVRHHPRIPAVHPRRLLTAPRAACPAGPARRRDHHRMPDVFHPVHAQPRQVREQRAQQASALLGNVPDKTRGAGRPRWRHDRLRRQRGSRARGSWQTRVLPEPRCQITPARRRYPRSSHSRHKPQAAQLRHELTIRNTSQNSRQSRTRGRRRCRPDPRARPETAGGIAGRDHDGHQAQGPDRGTPPPAPQG